MAEKGVLDGLIVVSLEQAVAAPYTSARLADAGARVIKVERPEGDFARNYDRLAGGEASYFVWLNRGKESIALDLRDANDMAVMRHMLAQADVFIQNLAQGAIDRLGLDDATLAGLNPRMIRCNISGYGPDGPYRERKAYDMLVQAESGLASVTGTADTPARVGISVCDIATGHVAYTGILEALIARGITGQGRRLDVAMFDVMADWMAVPLLQAEGSGRDPARFGLYHASIAPYGVYPCGDGREIVIAVQNPREWRVFCDKVLGDAALADDPRFNDPSGRVANRAQLDPLIARALGAQPRDAVAAQLDGARIAYALLNTAGDLGQHPQLRRVGVQTPSGTVSLPSPPVRAGAPEETRTPAPLGPVPALDEHGPALRKEFG
ncbi:CaiB/BaiF CoA transferase family protein [Alkalilacustris brevis]|uniref:CaiB/BaiF CoA transferase family protein n=1 Tax=Alkalilacustris brevis TaxID=2026338 RepID=UPI000E0CE615|nr:CaiB/BaiF CoA-transferase family protein [Alkalilacustris brevis]